MSCLPAVVGVLRLLTDRERFCSEHDRSGQAEAAPRTSLSVPLESYILEDKDCSYWVPETSPTSGKSKRVKENKVRMEKKLDSLVHKAGVKSKKEAGALKKGEASRRKDSAPPTTH